MRRAPTPSLLIVAALDQSDARAPAGARAELGLAALVEVHDEDELSRAIDGGARLIGVNNRNLRTLAVDVSASDRLAAQMPADVVGVSESGLQSRGELERLAAAGYRAFLIGERFMTDPDPARAIARADRRQRHDGTLSSRLGSCVLSTCSGFEQEREPGARNDRNGERCS